MHDVFKIFTVRMILYTFEIHDCRKLQKMGPSSPFCLPDSRGVLKVRCVSFRCALAICRHSKRGGRGQSGGMNSNEGGTAENKVGGAGDRGPGYSQPDWDTICRKQW